ncbi:MAG: hypothetical protein KDA52_20780, partial [Planctomycetaceae bacterium]|nr:hypothetical protein [Planctomycetaceae bacterium]
MKDGAGIEHSWSSSSIPSDPGLLIVEGSRIANNTADGFEGGAISARYAPFQMTNSVVEDNHSNGGDASGLFLTGDGFITTSTIRGNSGGKGAIYLFRNDFLIGETTIADNTTNAIHKGGDGDLVVINSTISQNSSHRSGAGIRFEGENNLKVINSTIARNHALSGSSTDDEGGGIFINAPSGTVEITNSTIAENTAGQGGGLFLSDGTLTMNNSIVANNIGTISNPDAVAFISGQFNLIENGTGAFFSEPNNVTGVDPMLSSLAKRGGLTATYGLLEGSPGLDAGDNTRAIDDLGATLVTDQRGAGFPRIVGITVDLGSVEGVVTANDVIYVNDDFTQADGTVLTDADPNTLGGQMAIMGMNAFSTIQAAISAVSVDGEILITDDLSTDGPGLYAENLVIDSNLTIRATEGDPSAVVIDGGSVDSVISVDVATVTLEALTIQHGSATDGGGIFNVGGTLMVIGSVVTDNAATRGGGIYGLGAAKTYIDDTSIDGNTASDSGGGVWNSAEGLLVIRNGAVITQNTASGDATTQGGGGVFNNGGRLAVIDSTISHNVAEGTSSVGGGVLSTDGIVTFEGSYVSMNQANRSGGGIEFLAGLLQLTDSDLDGNEAGP